MPPCCEDALRFVLGIDESRRNTKVGSYFADLVSEKTYVRHIRAIDDELCHGPEIVVDLQSGGPDLLVADAGHETQDRNLDAF